jgi:decaprenylphospho-beta-D-erythro-pentofuranosid-2-ulose 2-reductase
VSGKDSAERVIILGALSAIGEASARLFAASGARLVIAGRDATRLERVRDDLKVRGAGEVICWPVDFTAVADPHVDLARMAEALGGPVDAVLMFYGVLGDQTRAQGDIAHLRTILSVNFSSAAEWAEASAGLLERQNHGALVVITSVAGNRGRQSNYLYGAAKGGLSILVEGLAHRLAPGKARAVAVKLGFVDTPMTAHIKKGGPLWSTPDMVGQQIVAIARKPGRPVVYAPWFWWGIMSIIRAVPSVIFHKTKL